MSVPRSLSDSAAKCGQSAPGIAHMWHMGGHIFSKLKRYNDAAWQQEASARVDHAHMMRDRVLPDQIHNFAHNNEWLVLNLNNVGRVRDAISLAANMIELPRHPKYNTLSKRGSTTYGRMRLFETLRRYEKWQELIDYCHSPHLEPTDKETEADKRLRYLGMAHYRLGDIENGNQVLGELTARLDEQKAKRDEAVEKAKARKTEELKKKAKDDEQSGKDKKASLFSAVKGLVGGLIGGEVKSAGKAASKPFDRRIRDLERAMTASEGHREWAKGNFEKAYELLKKAGGEESCQLARVRFLAGRQDEAIAAVTRDADRRKNEVQPLACLVELLWEAGRKDEARKRFDALRTVAGHADLNASPVFDRLTDAAAAFGYPADWRTPAPLAEDVGNRVPLSSLGPFRWSPSDAPAWTLTDADGNPRSLKEYQGKPVVVIFYLGFGCLHCVEQLQAFAPEYGAFQDAGLEVIAISSDEEGGLTESVENFDMEELSIPLVSDPTLEVFKRYRCFDDFENTPLHGTFVISPDGKILWHDISYEPFMDSKFVLKEGKRLVKQHEARVDQTAPAESLTATAE